MAPTRGRSSAAKRGRGRPPGRKSTGATKPTQKRGAAKATGQMKPAQKGHTARKSKKRRTEPSQEEDEDELSGIIADDAQPSKRRKRKSHVEPDEIAEEEPKSRKKYVQLETKTRRIPQEQIDTWPQVSQQLLEQIVGVIRDAKKDIANTQRDERRVIAAHNTLNPLVRRLSRHLAASRIPPQAKDIHFNIDKLTERNAQISRSVTTARHSKLLLSEQVTVIERMSSKEEEALEQLKREVTKWRAEWKHQEKHGRLHHLLQNDSEPSNNGDGPDDISLKSSVPPYSTVFDAPDADLAPVLEQLRRSLESMQSNHSQVENIDEAMTDAQAALDDVLFRHTSAQQYAAL